MRARTWTAAFERDKLVGMPGHFLNFQPWLLQIRSSESALDAMDSDARRVFSLLESLEVNDETRAIFQRHLDGELTVTQLSDAIESYLQRNR